MSIKQITVRGARQHNLKNINVEIPRDKLTVITGLSGSGKSSLAFDTIYAEGQRRYVESLSAYARQFLDQLEKPDVDSVEGLSPAISIEQKTVAKSPRSTVGTVTEIYDYLRLLFSSVGQPHCHLCNAPITRQSVEQIVGGILQLPEGERVMILAPYVRGRKGEFKKELEKFNKDGFIRARIDGELRQLDEEIKLDKKKNHTIEVVVDRLLIKSGVKERLHESVKTALKITNGAVIVSVIDGDEKLYSEKMACINCGVNIPTLEPRSFSFNSMFGACKRCVGLGTIAEIDIAKLIPDANLPIAKLPLLDEVDKSGSNHIRESLNGLIKKFNDKIKKSKSAEKQTEIDAKKVRFIDLPSEIIEGFLHGVSYKIKYLWGEKYYDMEWKGAVRFLRERLHSAPSEKIRLALNELISPIPCPDCHGKRLSPEKLINSELPIIQV
jgi:excinuclease ABC subunit A